MGKFKEILNKIHFLPAQKAFNWIYVLAIVFMANLVTLLISRTLLNQTMTGGNIASFIGISLVVASIACLGYFGLEVFSMVVLAGNAMGIIYLFYIVLVLANVNRGWDDLTSLIGLLYFVVMGVFFGAIMQVIFMISAGKFLAKK